MTCCLFKMKENGLPELSFLPSLTFRESAGTLDQLSARGGAPALGGACMGLSQYPGSCVGILEAAWVLVSTLEAAWVFLAGSSNQENILWISKCLQ